MFAFAVTSLVQKSPTFDEQGFILRGLAYLRGEHQHIRVGHPLGLNALNALLLVSDESIQLPTDDSSWESTNFHRPAELFLWEIGNNVEKIMFLARVPTVWLGLLLAAFASRWARMLSRSRLTGLLALSLVAFDPNILAHTRLATTDLGLALGALLAGFTLWLFFQRPSWQTAVTAGICFGLLQDTKFTAGLFVPLFALVIVVGISSRWRRDGRFPTTLVVQLGAAFPLAAFFTLWAAYGFQIGPMPANLPTFSQLSGMTLPLSHHLEQLLDIGGRLQKGTPAFLLGHYSDSGWWTYFPIAFLFKTPLPSLIILAWAAVSHFSGNHKRLAVTTDDRAALLIPPLGYFSIALTSDINLGYRHLLPILPYFIIFAVTSIKQSRFFRQNHLIPKLFLIFWLLAGTIWIYPNFLASFNVLAGGPDSGWRALVDSNLDWGQDLAGLKEWMDDNGVPRVWLSYFGESRPDYYGIAYDGLDSFPPRLMNPEARPFTPTNPAPGVYAISASNLQGVQFTDHDEFVFFREREPIAKIGYSIFLYEVAANGPPAEIVMSGLQLDEIPPAEFAVLGTNNVNPHWFDAGQSFLWPEAGGWLALAGEPVVVPTFATMLDTFQQINIDPFFKLYKMPATNAGGLNALAVFRQAEDKIRLVDGVADGETAVAGSILTVTTRWQKQSQPLPVKIFIHLVGPDGNLAAQWDGLGAVWEGWRKGDILWQLSSLALSPDLPPGRYQLWTGLYNPITGERWQTETGDRVFISDLHIKEGGTR